VPNLEALLKRSVAKNPSVASEDRECCAALNEEFYASSGAGKNWKNMRGREAKVCHTDAKKDKKGLPRRGRGSGRRSSRAWALGGWAHGQGISWWFSSGLNLWGVEGGETVKRDRAPKTSVRHGERGRDFGTERNFLRNGREKKARQNSAGKDE